MRISRFATTAVVAGVLVFIFTAVLPSAGLGRSPSQPGKGLWHKVSGKLPATHNGRRPVIRPKKLEAFKLDQAGLNKLLKATDAKPGAKVLVALPTPAGTFQRFLLQRSSIMAPKLAALHPGIRTWRGRGVDDKSASIAADLSSLGFHASVRSARHATWYIDPYYHLDRSTYASYFGRDVPREDSGTFVERDADGAELSIEKGYYHADDDVTLNGSGYPENASITVTISDPQENFASRTLSASADAQGSFTLTFAADPDGNLDTHMVQADGGGSSASNSYQVVRADDPTVDPPTGDIRRVYRLALISDPGYAAYSGGPANVTAAKVALINRVDQVYRDDLSISLQLIGNNDLLNLNDWGVATAPNGPCGLAACFTQSNLTSCNALARNRIVIGQIIGASNYDIGHLALGQPGGGVASLGVVGRAQKAQGCTGIPTPTGDYYAIDYVAHEMGHQFSGNHPFNGTQLNCSGGNRNPATSTEPGSGSSIMAYAGICLTDDLQRHSDPYFSQRSLQEISTYTSSAQNAINEVQEVALRHFGGGNEVQVATFGQGFGPTSTIQPLTVSIGATPSATQLGGAQEFGNTVTISTGAAGSTHTLQPGDVVTIAGVANGGYNGTFTVLSVPTTRSFTYFNPVSGLPVSGGGTITLAVPGLRESGNTVTVSTVAAHGRSIGDVVTITGAGNAGYNGSWTITGTPTPRQFTFTNPTAGLPSTGAGTVTFIQPFNLRVAGNANNSPLINSANFTNAGLTAAFAAISGYTGTATVTGTSTTGFTVTYSGAQANTDVGNFSIQNLSCGGCFSSVEETNHGGTADSFKVTYNGNTSALITNGVNYTAAGLATAINPILPAGTVATYQAFGGGNISGLNNQGFAISFGGTGIAQTNIPFMLQVTNTSAGMSGFVNELDKGGAVDNKGGPGNFNTTDAIPVVSAPASYQIPLRTPFALTGNAVDADSADQPLLTYSWEQNDRGGSAGTTLLSNTKANGPLFAMFPVSGQISDADSLTFNSPGENHLTTNATRVFPDLQQIIDNNTNADTGQCPDIAPIAPPVPQRITECFAEFLPTSDYVGFAGTNAAPLSLHMRLTARDPHGGVNSADTTLLLTPATGPFRVTAPNTAVSWPGGTTHTITWDVAGTSALPINTANVKITLSTDGGHTYPITLAASTPNDGTEALTLPDIATATQSRVKVEAVGNVYFDISNTDFTIPASPPVSTAALDPATPDVNGWYVFGVKPTISATDVGSGVANTKCQLDGPAPATYDNLTLDPCPYTGASQYVMAEGVHTLYFASIDSAGNKEAVQPIVFKIDKTPPTSSVDSLPNFQGAATFPVSVTITDPLSGVGNYTVRYRQAASNGTFGAYTNWFTANGGGANIVAAPNPFTAPAGSTTCFSVRATDKAGWTPAAWSGEQCTTVPLDDTALTRVGLWSTVSGSGYYGPGVSRTTSIGASLSSAMRGQIIGVLVTKQPGGGTITLKWNGSTKLTTSLSAASVQKQQLLTFNLGSVQTGTLEISMTGYSTVDVDGAGAYKTS